MIASLQVLAAELDPEKTYYFRLRTGEELHAWVMEARGNEYKVRIDEPWEAKARSWTIPKDMIDEGPYVENSNAREERIDAGWRARGFENVDGAWLPAEEVKLAARARQMAKQAERPRIPHVPEIEAVAPGADDGTAEQAVSDDAVTGSQPGPLTKRGPQIIVVAIALALIGLVTKMMILGDSD